MVQRLPGIRARRLGHIGLDRLPFVVRGGPGAGLLDIPLNQYLNKVSAVEAANLIDIWTLFDQSGGVAVDSINAARNGTYVNSPKLQAATFPDGVNNAPIFASAQNQYVNIFSASLAAAFSLAEGSLLIWALLSAADWADSLNHVLICLGATATNQLKIYKAAQPNTWAGVYTGGGVSLNFGEVSIPTPTTWQAFCLTWSTTGNRTRVYRQGIQRGIDNTPLPLWTGALTAGNCSIASDFAAPALLADGGVAFAALWTKELTPAEVLTVSTCP